MCVVYNGWQIGVVWMYGDGDSGILCSLKTYLPLLEVLGTVWVALFFFLFYFFFYFLLESTQISFLDNEMVGSNKKQLELY
jgi:hypothetical protein